MLDATPGFFDDAAAHAKRLLISPPRLCHAMPFHFVDVSIASPLAAFFAALMFLCLRC